MIAITHPPPMELLSGSLERRALAHNAVTPPAYDTFCWVSQTGVRSAGRASAKQNAPVGQLVVKVFSPNLYGRSGSVLTGGRFPTVLA